MIELRAGPARARIDPEHGGRLAALSVDGLELLVGPDHDPMRWGSYPMVPFAGRIRDGRFTLDGRTHQLPPNLPPHAIHGYGYTSPWEVVDDRTIAWTFADPWPFAGRAEQTVDLRPDRLVLRLRAEAVDRQPLVVGWHPWFRRDLGVGDPVTLAFGPARMYELDQVAIPTGRLVEPSSGPWDNCFTDLAADPVLRWGGELELRLASGADHWVIYTEPEHAVCVEPQTDAPDAVNRGRSVLDAGDVLDVSFELVWRISPPPA